jgi:hypothetical protein
MHHKPKALFQNDKLSIMLHRGRKPFWTRQMQLLPGVLHQAQNQQ